MLWAERLIRDFEDSVKTEALIPPGSAIDHIPEMTEA